MSTPLVSILIPAYNAARWLPQTLASAAAQEGCRTEIIVVDDGSTDGTPAVAAGFEGAGVRVVSQPNAGAAAARNRAFSMAHGDYIQWLDADDLLSPGKINAQISCAGPDESGLLRLSGISEFYRDPRRATTATTSLCPTTSPVEFLLRKFTLNAWSFPGAWLVSRGLCERAGPWAEALSLDDDGEYFSRLVSLSDGVRFCPSGTAYYRRGQSGSLSRSASISASESLLRSLDLCFQYLRTLEDSARTRAACLAYLQTWTDHSEHFHPDRADLLPRVQRLAAALGGEVNAPTLDWRYRAVKNLLGWPAVRRLKAASSNLRLAARVERDRLSLALSRSTFGSHVPLPGGPAR